MFDTPDDYRAATTFDYDLRAIARHQSFADLNHYLLELPEDEDALWVALLAGLMLRWPCHNPEYYDWIYPNLASIRRGRSLLERAEKLLTETLNDIRETVEGQS